MSGRGAVPGAYGYGKVALRFRERKQKSVTFQSCLAVLLFSIGTCILTFKYAWIHAQLRVFIALPPLRAVLEQIDFARMYIWSSHMSPNHRFSISRDPVSGIVNMHASSLADAVFAQGYTHAVDRLFQMDISRRTALGRLSEICGDSTLAMDRFIRTLDIAGLAASDLEALQQQHEENANDRKEDPMLLLEAYSSGVNSYLNERRLLPLEYFTLPSGPSIWPYSTIIVDVVRNFFVRFMGMWDSAGMSNTTRGLSIGAAPTSTADLEPWQPLHTLAILRLHSFELDHGWEQQLTRAILTEVFGPRVTDALDDNLYRSRSSSTSSATPPPLQSTTHTFLPPWAAA